MASSTTRRDALKHLGVAVGTVGAAVAVPHSVSARTPAAASALPDAPTPLTDTRVLSGTRWTVKRPGTRAGTAAAPGTPRLPHGVLVDDGGTHVGTYSSEIAPAALGGGQLHRLDLTDGTITASVDRYAEDSILTVVAGTGRYARSRGTYSLRQDPQASRGSATIRLDLVLEGN